MKERPLKTDFAPAERSKNEQLINQLNEIINNELLVNFSNSVSQMVVVLNENRQIVFSNKPFNDFLGMEDTKDILGKRPGEAVNCIHAFSGEGGCGTTEFCRKCGAINAILESQKGEKTENECRILTVNNDALDLKVSASPFKFNGNSFTIFTITDISDEKRKHILERLFYHDVLNSAGGISGLSGIMPDLSDRIEMIRIAGLINRASENLIEEIQVQRQLTSAEKGDLIPDFNECYSLQILKDLADLYSKHPLIEEKFIVIRKNSHLFSLNTDKVLLRRIIGNMIKNALEASFPGDTVTLYCKKESGKSTFTVHNKTFIPREIQLQLFKRSFTTKGTGRGLGTYSMKLLGEKYLKGKVGFESTPEEGTTFFIDL